jgi:hypothetical protein
MGHRVRRDKLMTVKIIASIAQANNRIVEVCATAIKAPTRLPALKTLLH